MQLTQEQFNTLRLVVRAEPSLQTALAQGQDNIVKEWCDATTTFVVWKSSVTEQEVMEGFDWTRVDNLSVGKSRIWDWMFRFGQVNPAKTNIRAGIDATWVGTAQDLAVRAAVLAKCKRFATNAEAVLASGLGTESTPGVMSFEGKIDIETAGLFKL